MVDVTLCLVTVSPYFLSKQCEFIETFLFSPRILYLYLAFFSKGPSIIFVLETWCSLTNKKGDLRFWVFT